MFLTVLQTGKYKIKVPADSVYGDSLILVLQVAFFLYPHRVEAREKERALLCLL